MNEKSSELIGIGRLKIRDGQLQEYKRIALQCMQVARTKDKGTLQYDIFFNDDESEVMFVERYKDSNSLLEHFTNLGPLMEEILATVTVVHGELLGELSPELRKMMDASEYEYPHLFANKL